jgi:hypothetical protein
MMIKHIIETNKYHLLSEQTTLTRSFFGCYQSDLLSRVIKNAQPDQLLVTIINHINTVATATMLDLSGIIICEDQMPSAIMIDRCNQEGIALIKTSQKSHEVIIDLYQRGLI